MYISEKEIDRLTTETGKILAAQPKVSIMIDRSHGDYWEGGINGHMFRIKTGVVVEVPRDLATLIAQNAAVMEQAKKAVADFAKPGGKKVSKE